MHEIADASPCAPGWRLTRLAAIRLLVGLLQGLALYGLSRIHATNTPGSLLAYCMVPLWLVTWSLPQVYNLSLGHLKRRQTLRWCLLLFSLLSGLGIYDAWHMGAAETLGTDAANGLLEPQPALYVMSFMGLYIAQSLVLAGAAEGRWVASYAGYFDHAWQLLVQWQFSSLFVCAVWLVLWLGGSLFSLVGLQGPQALLDQAVFAFPVSSLALACGLHITDVRPTLVRNLRTLMLNLLGWTLPVSTLCVTGFLLVLPWTGLHTLWATGHATWVMLSAVMALVLLINAVVQDGRPDAPAYPPLRWSARIAALCLLPMVLIAAYAMALRVADYGWTTDRILGASGIAVAGCYGVGYAWAALGPQAWAQRLARTNVAIAFAVLAVLLALLSPLADPARLSVNSQLARLESGRVPAAAFDFNYLHTSGLRFGRQALEQLRTAPVGSDPALVRRAAQRALDTAGREPAGPSPQELAVQLQVWPAGAALPASFIGYRSVSMPRAWEIPQCLRDAKTRCDVYLDTRQPTGQAQLLVVGRERHSGAALLREHAPGEWESVGTLPPQAAGCDSLRQQLQAGADWQRVPSTRQDLLINQQRLTLQMPADPIAGCPQPSP